MSLGAVIGQCALIAAYFCWGTENWISRGSKAGLTLVLVWHSMALAVYPRFNYVSLYVLLELGLILGMSFCFYCIPLGLMRAATGIRFDRPLDDHEPAQLPLGQFRLRDLLAWTTAAGILAWLLQSPVGRELWELRRSFTGREFWFRASGPALVAALSCLVTIPALWFAPRRFDWTRRWRLGAGVFLAVIAAGLTVLEATEDDVWRTIAGLIIGVLVEVIACSAALRMAGYRLRPATKTSKRTSTNDPG
jgi:hypothetical protein